MASNRKPTGKQGPPTIRTPENADLICGELEKGITLREICRTHGMAVSKVYVWMDEDKDFEGRFARSREIGDEALFEECLDIADNGTNDWMKRREARDGKPEGLTFDADHVQRSKLRVWTRLEILKRRNAKKYGEQIKVTDGDGNPTPGATVNLSGLTPEHLRAIAAARLEGE